MIALDESYYEYFGYTSAKLIRRHGNLVIIRSLFEGMIPDENNCSYILSSPANLSIINKNNNRHDSSDISRITAISLLKNLDRLRTQIEGIHENMISLLTKIRRLGLTCRPTPLDRLLVELSDPTAAAEYLNSNDIPTQDLSHYPQLENYISLFIGDDKHSELTMRAFEKMPVSFMRDKTAGQSRIVMNRPPEKASKRKDCPKR